MQTPLIDPQATSYREEKVTTVILHEPLTFKALPFKDGYRIEVENMDQYWALENFWKQKTSLFKTVFAKKLDLLEPAKAGAKVHEVEIVLIDRNTKAPISSKVLTDGSGQPKQRLNKSAREFA